MRVSMDKNEETQREHSRDHFMQIFGDWVEVFLVISVHRNSYDTYILSGGPTLREFEFCTQ